MWPVSDSSVNRSWFCTHLHAHQTNNKIRPVSDSGPHMKVDQTRTLNRSFHIMCAVHTGVKTTNKQTEVSQKDHIRPLCACSVNRTLETDSRNKTCLISSITVIHKNQFLLFIVMMEHTPTRQVAPCSSVSVQKTNSETKEVTVSLPVHAVDGRCECGAGCLELAVVGRCSSGVLDS